MYLLDSQSHTYVQEIFTENVACFRYGDVHFQRKYSFEFKKKLLGYISSTYKIFYLR